VELKDLQDFLGQSPAVRLLRANHGALILHFLHREFKEEQRSLVPDEQLVADLAEDQTWLVDSGQADTLNGEPCDYLNQWCKSEVRYLQRFYQSGSDEPVYQLTSPAETALRFVREALASDWPVRGRAKPHDSDRGSSPRAVGLCVRKTRNRQIENLEAGESPDRSP